MLSGIYVAARRRHYPIMLIPMSHDLLGGVSLIPMSHDLLGGVSLPLHRSSSWPLGREDSHSTGPNFRGKATSRGRDFFTGGTPAGHEGRPLDGADAFYIGRAR